MTWRRVLTATTTLLALVGLLPTPAAAGSDIEGLPPSPPRLAAMWIDAQARLAAADADQAALAAQPIDPAAGLLAAARHDVLAADAGFRYREAARTEQVVVYAMAIDPAVEAAVLARIPAGDRAPVQAVIGGLRALWRSAEIDDWSLIRIRYNRDFHASQPVDSLFGYYRQASGRYAIDWTYLASINYIESDFGRVLGPSSAGAMGPMQFMPATWSDFGAGGDIMSPPDSITAAARYLRAMGGPGDMRKAIFRYNNDNDYVASVQAFADAFRLDPGYVRRLYYWGTSG